MYSVDRLKIGKSDFFKKLEDVYLPDSRWQYASDPEGVLIGFHKNIAQIKLNAYVSNEIFINFETAKNTLLYSYFSYRLCMSALSLSFTVLESAIEEKAELVGCEEKIRGLSRKLKVAFSNDWIDIRKVMSPVNLPKEKLEWDIYVESVFIPYLLSVRNDLAHEFKLLEFPLKVCEMMEIIAKMINELFKERSTSETL